MATSRLHGDLLNGEIVYILFGASWPSSNGVAIATSKNTNLTGIQDDIAFVERIRERGLNSWSYS